MQEKVHGIDLGTTYSCVAGIDEFGKVVVLENDSMETTTPSVVWFDNDNKMMRRVFVGAVAKEQACVNLKDVVSAIKRSMGTDKVITQRGKQLTPEMVSALILKKLVKDAAANGEDVHNVVITCPAYYGPAQRQAVKNAGALAGLNVLSIINEPTAAAISYLYENPTLKGKVSLVFDLGGGTFDVSIVRIEEGKDNEVLASDGDSFLGGRDWDKLIGDYFIERFCEETGYDYHTAINDSSFKAFAMSCAEKHKRYLSDMSKTRVSFERYGKHCSFDFTRNEFDEKTSGLLQSAIIKARGVIEKAKAKCSDFNDKDMEILMVGGSTLMPQIREMLEKEFGIIPKLYRPHEAVARGALLYACQIMKNNRGGGELYLGGNEQSNKLGDLILGGAIYDVSSKGYGIRLVRSEDDEIGYVKNLIPKNERLPFDPGTGREDEKGENHCCTVVGNQTAIIFEIYENDEMSYGNDIDIDECTYIGEMKITGLPERRPAGMPCTVFMKLGTDGILYASGRDDSTGKHCNAEIKISGVISESEISNAKSIVDSFVIQ